MLLSVESTAESMLLLSEELLTDRLHESDYCCIFLQSVARQCSLTKAASSF
jgi:hypothetical protein